MTNKRIIYSDLIRIIAGFLVVMLHTSGILWTYLDVTTLDWSIINIYNSLSRCCVQIFIMLSGMFLLNPTKNISDKSIYTKYLPRIVIALLFWSSVYLIRFPFNIESVKYIVVSILKGQTNYHLWFLYMVIGLYIVTPILRIITKNATKSQIEYFLFLGIFISILLPSLSQYFPFSFISTNIDKMYLFLPRSYLIFYLLGFYLTYFEMNKKTQNIIYILGILGALFTISITQYLSLNNLEPIDSWQGVFSMNTLCYSVAVFVFLRNLLSKVKVSDTGSKIIHTLSNCSFGVFLTHDLFLKLLIKLDIISPELMSPIITLPIIALGVFIASNITSYIINKIPIINKYII